MKRDIRKLDDLDPSERLAAFLKMFPGSPDQPVRPGRSFLDILKGEDDDGDDDADLADHPIAELVRLLVAAGNKPDTAAALHHLRAALLHRTRTHKAAKDDSMDTVHAIMKDGGIAVTCANIIAKGSTTITEQELVDAVSNVAAERYPGLTESQAFAKVYADQGAEGRSLREAINVAKASLAETMLGPGLPVQVVGGPAAQNVDAAEEAEKARAELMRIGRRQWPDRAGRLRAGLCRPAQCRAHGALVSPAVANIDLSDAERMAAGRGFAAREVRPWVERGHGLQ